MLRRPRPAARGGGFDGFVYFLQRKTGSFHLRVVFFWKICVAVFFLKLERSCIIKIVCGFGCHLYSFKYIFYWGMVFFAVISRPSTWMVALHPGAFS